MRPPPPETVVLSAPIGMVILWPGLNVPQGWDHCWGQAISRTTYAELFTIINIQYGPGDGVNTFNLPDFRLKFARGANSTFFPGWDKGNIGGNAMTTLVIANLPPHGHQVPYSLNLGTAGTVRLGDAGTGGVFTTGLSNGTSTPFSNEPPYQNIDYLIKATHVSGHF